MFCYENLNFNIFYRVTGTIYVCETNRNFCRHLYLFVGLKSNRNIQRKSLKS